MPVASVESTERERKAFRGDLDMGRDRMIVISIRTFVAAQIGTRLDFHRKARREREGNIKEDEQIKN